MRRYVIDASALLRYLEQEAGWQTVKKLFEDALDRRVELMMSAVNWGEVFYFMLKAHGVQAARQRAAQFSMMPMRITPVSPADAENAATFRQDSKVPYADSFAGSLAQKEKATLITADFDFKTVAGVITVQFLPAKSTGPRP